MLPIVWKLLILQLALCAILQWETSTLWVSGPENLFFFFLPFNCDRKAGWQDAKWEREKWAWDQERFTSRDSNLGCPKRSCAICLCAAHKAIGAKLKLCLWSISSTRFTPWFQMLKIAQKLICFSSELARLNRHVMNYGFCKIIRCSRPYNFPDCQNLRCILLLPASY